jgi:hypothetical protein
MARAAKPYRPLARVAIACAAALVAALLSASAAARAAAATPVSSVCGALVASFTDSPTSGPAPLHVDFDASTSTDDVGIVGYRWEFGDGFGSTDAVTSHDYGAGLAAVTLTVTDTDGNQCQAADVIRSDGGFVVDDLSVNESAGTATFHVAHAGGFASVDIAVTPGTASMPADFTAVPATLFFAGTQAVPYTVTINQDLMDEPTETFTVTLSNPVNGSLADGTALGTIVDDDPPARLSVKDANVIEGNSGTKNLVFRVRLTRPSAKIIKVAVHTADGSARAPSDYRSVNSVLTFTPGQTVIPVPIPVVGDRVREPNETFALLLTNPVNAGINDPSGTGGIVNND